MALFDSIIDYLIIAGVSALSQLDLLKPQLGRESNFALQQHFLIGHTREVMRFKENNHQLKDTMSRRLNKFSQVAP